MVTQELILNNHAHISPWATNLAETTRQHPMPEKGHFLQERALSPGHTQQPPALLIEWRVQVDVQGLDTIFHIIIWILLIVDKTIHSAIEAQVTIHCQFIRICAKARAAQ